MIVSAVQQRESAICIKIYPLFLEPSSHPPPPYPSSSSQSTEQSSLCYIAAFQPAFQPATYFTHGSVCMPMSSWTSNF